MTVMNTNTWCLSGGGGMVTSWFTLGGGQRHRTWMNFWRKCRYWAWFDMKTLCSSWGHVLSHLTLLLLQGKYPVLASLSIVYLFESLLSARSKCKREFTLRECSGDIRKPSGVFGNQSSNHLWQSSEGFGYISTNFEILRETLYLALVLQPCTRVTLFCTCLTGKLHSPFSQSEFSNF